MRNWPAKNTHDTVNVIMNYGNFTQAEVNSTSKYGPWANSTQSDMYKSSDINGKYE
jgi:hypothetical protein